MGAGLWVPGSLPLLLGLGGGPGVLAGGWEAGGRQLAAEVLLHVVQLAQVFAASDDT